jgi:hypothetical protein
MAARSMRNLAAAALIAVLTTTAPTTAPKTDPTRTMATSLQQCEDPPFEQWCSYFETWVACHNWDSSCYMLNSYTEPEAQFECEDIGDTCGFAATAVWDGECWWTCEFEQWGQPSSVANDSR